MLIYLFNICFAGRIEIANIMSLFNGILYHLFKTSQLECMPRFYKWINFTYNHYWILIITLDLKIYKILYQLVNYNWNKSFRFLFVTMKGNSYPLLKPTEFIFFIYFLPPFTEFQVCLHLSTYFFLWQSEYLF